MANDVVRRMAADRRAGTPGGTIGEPFNRPLTAHFIGGCTIGESPDDRRRRRLPAGVRPPRSAHRRRSTVSANLGVNPSLTITAQAERAMAFWPNKGEADPRPAARQRYKRVKAVAPKNPTVPEHAPAALRLPIHPSDRRTVTV